jgi:secondary thiamine-phosphate synthase enzyme
MMSKTEYLIFNTKTTHAFVNITQEVRNIVKESGIKEGLCLVNAMHITASVFINDNESGLHEDFDTWLEKLVPHAPTEQYKHNETGEDNADAHLKRQVMGREVIVAITILWRI